MLYVAFRRLPSERLEEEKVHGPIGGGHVQVQVFVGRADYARGNAGTITMRRDEWEDLEALLNQRPVVVRDRVGFSLAAD